MSDTDEIRVNGWCCMELLVLLVRLLLAVYEYLSATVGKLAVGWSAMTVLIASAGYWYFCRPRRKLIKELKLVGSQIPKDRQLDKDSLVEAEKYFEKAKRLYPLWVEYRRAVDKAVGSDLLDPRLFFSYQKLISRDGMRRFSYIMPGALTGLGILGTFIGLVLGLWRINLSTAETLQASINTLMHGMKTAFITSIVGIICSLFYSFFNQRLENRVLQAFHRVQDALVLLFPFVSEYTRLENMVAMQGEQLSTFKTFVSDTLIPEIVGGFRQALQDTVQPEMQRTVDIFRNFTRESYDRFFATLCG